MSPAGPTVELADLLPAAAHLGDELVDQRRLQGHVGDHVLHRLARVGDGSRRALAIGGRPPPGGERGLEPADLPLEPADALERQHHRADGLCFELPALGEHDYVVGRHFASTQLIPNREECLDGHRDPDERTAKGDLADLDPSSDLDFLRCSEQGDLADLLQVETDRILALGQTWGIRLLGGRTRSLFRVVIHHHLCFALSGRGHGCRSHGAAFYGVRSLAKCHRVTGFL